VALLFKSTAASSSVLQELACSCVPNFNFFYVQGSLPLWIGARKAYGKEFSLLSTLAKPHLEN